MITKHLIKTKIVFSIFIASLMAMVIFVTQNQVLEKQVSALERESRYLGYKVELSGGTDNGSKNLAAVGAFMGGLLNRLGQVSYSAANQIERAGVALSVPVFAYHGIVEKPDEYSLTEEKFKEQMFALKKAGYKTITLEDFVLFLEGKKVLPKKSFLLTFDDGRKDSYRESDPMLKALGFNAVMFVASGQSLISNVGNEYYLGREEIMEMIATGRWEIQSHAVQRTGGFISIDEHGNTEKFLSNRMWLASEDRLENGGEYEARVRDELLESKHAIEELTKKEVISFSYPFGDFGQNSVNFDSSQEVIKSTLQQAGYKLAFRLTWSLDDTFTSNFAGAEDPYYLKRKEPDTAWSGDQLIDFIEKGTAKELPFGDMFSRDSGWKTTWGEQIFGENYMEIKARENAKGSFTFLDGTKFWRDYIYKVNIDWDKGGYVTLFARYQDDDNHVSCTFGDDMVKIEEKVNGKIRLLITDENPIKVTKKNTELGMSVQGSQIRCYEGQAVATLVLNHTNNEYGGVGIRIWDEQLNNGSIKIYNLEVREAGDSESLISSMPLYDRN